MATSVFCTVPRLLTGAGSFAGFGEMAEALGTRALLVTGKNALRKQGILDKALAMLEEAGVECQVFDAVPAEPPLSVVDEGRMLAANFNANLIIGVGGGSAMDVAKCIAGLIKEQHTAESCFNGAELSGQGLPFMAVPTTFGTGAEATPNAVLSDPANKVKKSIRHPSFMARAAIVDPELGMGAPQEVKASSGMDALTQAIESYVSIHASPISDALAFSAAGLLLRNLEAFVLFNEAGAASECAHASLMAGMALANARLGLVHGVAHPLGARYGVPHGKLCGMLLAPSLRFNQQAIAAKYDKLSILAGGDIADKCEALRQKLGQAASLSSLGVKLGDLPTIIAESMPSGSLKANPRIIKEADLEAFLRENLFAPNDSK